MDDNKRMKVLILKNEIIHTWSYYSGETHIHISTKPYSLQSSFGPVTPIQHNTFHRVVGRAK